MVNRITHLLIRLIIRLIARVEVSGLENIPLGGPYIVVANHIGRLDAALVYYILDRKDIIMMVAEKYKSSAFYRLLVKAMNAIWIDRYNADLNAIREIMRRLKAGGVLVMAPEGTRSPTASLQAGRDGASYLAAKAGLTILPVGMTGTEDEVVSERLRHFKRLQIVGQAGKTFTLPPLSIKNRDTQLPQFTEEIMCQIAALLPESYRGIYADHPRTLELLSQAEQGK
jgi:1-acyl-sn-glycerol-3-phosphate acyltransferase